jgi:hypothetical protein
MGEEGKSDGEVQRIEASDPTSVEMAALRISAESEKRAAFKLDLSAVEDVYRAAGIVSPQKGYNVHKVVETLHSEPIAKLPADLKRAAVLMALDAAGVSLDQIHMDAQARQDALDRYEAEQRRLAEADWARRAEDTMQIQAELERVKACYMSRITRNMESVVREKAIFNNWVELKKREVKALSVAMDLCAKTKTHKPASAPMAKAAAAGRGRGKAD